MRRSCLLSVFDSTKFFIHSGLCLNVLLTATIFTLPFIKLELSNLHYQPLELLKLPVHGSEMKSVDPYLLLLAIKSTVDHRNTWLLFCHVILF